MPLPGRPLSAFLSAALLFGVVALLPGCGSSEQGTVSTGSEGADLAKKRFDDEGAAPAKAKR